MSVNSSRNYNDNNNPTINFVQYGFTDVGDGNGLTYNPYTGKMYIMQNNNNQYSSFNYSDLRKSKAKLSGVPTPLIGTNLDI